MRERRERNSGMVAPMVVPWPQVVSRTGITVLVDERDEVRAVAMREREEEREEELVAPGLGGGLLVYLLFYGGVVL
jgi:hypothetical protein